MSDRPKSVCAFTSVCEEDAIWLPQYLREAERLLMPFCMLLDRCSQQTIDLVRSHSLCMGHHVRRTRREFDETCKQVVFELCGNTKSDWAMAWDVDETWCVDFPDKLESVLAEDVDWVNLRWVNLWNDTSHHRADIQGHRDKFFNLRSGKWRFISPIVNGPKLLKSNGRPLNGGRYINRHDVSCVHHGMMTHELRVLHKERWDRIYGATKYSGNPYGFWTFMLDYENHPPVVEEWHGK